MNKHKEQDKVAMVVWAEQNGVRVQIKEGTAIDTVVCVLRGMADYMESGKLPK